MEQLYTYSTKLEKCFVAILHIYGDRANLILFRFMTKTLNQNNVK